MMEWLILCLLVPAVVVPVVLLWGFVGCNWIFGLDPTRLVRTTFELDSENNFDSPTAMDLFTLEGFSFVVRIPQFLLSEAGPAVIVTVRGANTADLQIDRLYISQAADSVDASKDPSIRWRTILRRSSMTASVSLCRWESPCSCPSPITIWTRTRIC